MEPIPKIVVWWQLLTVRMYQDLLPTLTFGLAHCAERVEPAFDQLLPGVGQVNDDDLQEVEAAIVGGNQGKREKQRFILHAGFDQLFVSKSERACEFAEGHFGERLENPSRSRLVIDVRGEFQFQGSALAKHSAFALLDAFKASGQRRIFHACTQT